MSHSCIAVWVEMKASHKRRIEIRVTSSHYLTNVRTAFTNGDGTLSGANISGRFKVGAILTRSAATSQSNQKLTKCSSNQESILPNFHFSGFLIFAVKLESLQHMKKCVSCTTAKLSSTETEKFFVYEEKKFGRIDSWFDCTGGPRYLRFCFSRF